MPVPNVDVRPLRRTPVLLAAVVFVALVLAWLGATPGGALARDFPLPPRGADIGAAATAPLAGTWIGTATSPDRSYRIMLFYRSGTRGYDGKDGARIHCIFLSPAGLEKAYCSHYFFQGDARSLRGEMVGEYGDVLKGLFAGSSAFGDLELSQQGDNTLTGTWHEASVVLQRLVPGLESADANPVAIDDLEYLWRHYRANGGSWTYRYSSTPLKVTVSGSNMPPPSASVGEIVVDDPHFQLISAGINAEGKLEANFQLHEGVEAGRKVLTIAGGASIEFDLVIKRPPEPPSLELRSLVDRLDRLVHAFGPERPANALVAGPQDETEQPPIYGLRFAARQGPGSGTVVSSDPDVIELVKEGFTDADAGADGTIVRRFVAKKAGTATLTVTWTCCTGRAPVTLTDSFTVTVSPVDLSIVGVPDFAEDDAGGYARVGSLTELSLSYPTDAARVQLAALRGGERIRLWADRAKTKPLALPLSLDAEGGPRRVFVEHLVASQTVRDIGLRLSFAGIVSLGEWDTVALTGVDMKLEGDAVVGLNDDDDDLNDQKDHEQDVVTAGDDDLRPLTITVQPSVDTFGRRLLDVSGGVSLWQSPDKTEGTPLVDASNNARAPVLLDGAELVRTLHMEGITPLAPALIRLTLSPHLSVGGQSLPMGPTLTETAQVSVVQADIDIVGVADLGNAEWIKGADVPIVDDDQPDMEDLTEVRLHVRPFQAQVKAVRLAMPRGAENIKLWRAKGTGPVERDQLVPIVLAGETQSAVVAHSDPWDTIYVQGLSESGERGAELVMSVYADPGATQFVHEDRVTFTVRDEMARGEALSLRPLFLILPQEITDPVESALTVRLQDGEGETVADVTEDAETEYEWVGKGLNDLIDLTEYPVAQLEMNEKGTLTVLSPGVQFVRARRGELTSSPMLVLAGFQLDEIELGAVSPLGLPLQAMDNPPLILSQTANSQVLGYGYLELTDLSFKALGHDDLSLSYSELRKLLLKAFVAQPELGPALGAVAILLESARDVADKLVTFKSADPEVAATSIIPSVVSGVGGGLAGIEGTLTLPFGLGSASDTVLTFVLPSLDHIDVIAAGDEQGKHDAPILLGPLPERPSADIHGVVVSRPIVRATLPLGKTFETYEEALDAILPGGTEGLFKGEFDILLSIRMPSGDTEFRLSGRLREAEEEEQSSAVFEDVVIGVPLVGTLPQSWTIERSPETAADTSALPASIPPGPGPAELWLTVAPIEGLGGDVQVSVETSILGLGEAKGSRPLVVETIEKVPACEASPPILRLGGGTLPSQSDSIAVLDARFTASEAPDGIVLSQSPFAAAVQRAAGAYGPIARLGSMEPGTNSAPAGWIYAIEIPVNDPRSCDVHVQRSIAAGEGGDTRNISQTNQRGQSLLRYAIARYDTPVDGKPYALIYAGTFGWSAGVGEVRKAGGLEERLSIFDTGSGSYLATAIHALRLAVDGHSAPPQFWSQVLIASSSGPTGTGYLPQTPDAAEQLRALPELGVQ